MKKEKKVQDEQQNLKVVEPERTEFVDDVAEQRSEAFEKIRLRFKEDEGYIHVKIKRDKEPFTKIGKYRPTEFDLDEIAKEFGSGLYFCDLRNASGQREAVLEERYTISPKEITNKTKNDESLLSIVNTLTDKIMELSRGLQELKSQPKTVNSEELTVQSILKTQIDAMNNFMTSMAGSFKNSGNNSPSIKELLEIVQTVQSLMPKSVNNTPASINDAIELASVLSELKENGNIDKSESLVDIIKQFLTGGGLASVLAGLKQKNPIVENIPEKQVVENKNPQTPSEMICKFFQTYEDKFLEFKLSGMEAESVADVIYAQLVMNKELQNVFYVFLNEEEKAINDIFTASKILKDKDYIANIIKSLRISLYGQESKKDEKK